MPDTWYWFNHEGNNLYFDPAGNFNKSIGGAGDRGTPAEDDTVWIDDVASGDNITINAATAALGEWNMGGMSQYSGTMTVDNPIDVKAGNCSLVGTIVGNANISAQGSVWFGVGADFTGYGGQVIHDGTSGSYMLVASAGIGPALTINNAGITVFVVASAELGMAGKTLTMTAGKLGANTKSVACGLLDHNGGELDLSSATHACTTFDRSGGTLDGSGAVNVAGDLLITGGTDNYTGPLSQTGSGDLTITRAAQKPAHLRLAWGGGVESTLAGAVFANKCSRGAGTVILGANVLTLYHPDADDCWVDGAGTVTRSTGSIKFDLDAARDQAAITAGVPVTVAGETLRIMGQQTVTDFTVTSRLIAWGSLDGGGNSAAVEFAPRQLETMPVAA